MKNLNFGSDETPSGTNLLLNVILTEAKNTYRILNIEADL
jgi:hypothetical protein